MEEVNLVSFFSGCGGLDLGFQNAGANIVLASDYWKPAEKTYTENFDHRFVGEDIRELSDQDLEEALDHEGYQPEDVNIVTGSPPCFPEKTEITTLSGRKNIEDIEKDDVVATHTGSWQKVTETMERNYEGKMYNLKLQYNLSLECTAKHPILTRKKEGTELSESQWLKAEELTEDHYIAFQTDFDGKMPEKFKYERTVNQFKTVTEEINLKDEDFWWLVGYYVAEGWYRKDRTITTFAVTDGRKRKAEKKINEFFDSVYKEEGRTCDKLQAQKLGFYEFVKRLGNKAHEKRLPPEFLQIEEQYLEALIDGYNLGDGYFRDNKQRGNTVSRQLAKDLQIAYTILYGSVASNRKRETSDTTIIEGREVNQRDQYSVEVNKTGNAEKYIFIEDGKKWINVKEIESSIEKKTVYNLEVENDHTYIANNFCVHNCQGFSRLNNERIELDEMEKDERNLLFEEFLRVVDFLNPEVVVMENVDDLSNRKTSDGKYLVDIIEQEFNRRGYKVEYKVLDAEKFGVPQSRSRMIFIGYRKPFSPVFPSPTTPQVPQTSGEKLSDIDSELPNMDFYDEDEETVEKMKHIPQGGYYKDLPYDLKTKKYRCSCEDKEQCPHDKQVVKRYGTYLRRLDPDEPSVTVSNNPLIHPEKDRYLTPREKARLQTFPDSFVFKGSKNEVEEQIGNAVPVELAEELADHIVGFFPDVWESEEVDTTVKVQRGLSEL